MGRLPGKILLTLSLPSSIKHPFLTLPIGTLIKVPLPAKGSNDKLFKVDLANLVCIVVI